MSRAVISQDHLNALDDYTRGRMSDAEAEAFEEQLFQPEGELAAAARFTEELRRMASYLVSRSTFGVGHTRRELEPLMREHSFAIVDCGTGGTIHAQVSRRAELIATRMQVDLRGIDRVDLESYVEGYGHVKTIRDLHFDPDEGELFLLCEAPLAHLTYEHNVSVHSKLIGWVGDERRVLGEGDVTVTLVD